MNFAVLLGQMGENTPSAPLQSAPWLLVSQWLMPLIGLGFFCLLFVCIYRAAKFFDRAGTEQKLLRIEMGKLAEEVHLLRQDIKGDKNADAST